jgi:hypothetical protein
LVGEGNQGISSSYYFFWLLMFLGQQVDMLMFYKYFFSG